MLSLVALGLVAGREKESVGSEFCNLNGCFEAEANICAGDDYRLVADISVRDGDRRPLLTEKGADGELAHGDSCGVRVTLERCEGVRALHQFKKSAKTGFSRTIQVRDNEAQQCER